MHTEIATPQQMDKTLALKRMDQQAATAIVFGLLAMIVIFAIVEWVKRRRTSKAAALHDIFARGVTHPQIHVDYYAWLSSLSEFERNFMATATPHGIAMWAWSRSRETLNEAVKAPVTQVVNAIPATD